jgi:hypothetical protein
MLEYGTYEVWSRFLKHQQDKKITHFQQDNALADANQNLTQVL